MQPGWRGTRLSAAAAGLTALASGYLTVQGLAHPDALLAGGAEPAARVLGAYGAVRTITLNGATVAAAVTRRWGGLRVMLVLNAAVQVGDAAVGAWQGEVVRVTGPACFAALLLVAATRLRPPATVAGASRQTA
jgi:hypothetical protein